MVQTAASTTTELQAQRDAQEPVVTFEHVQLAFDDKVVLKDISFSLLSGHTKIILGASGSGKSITLKIIAGLLRADAGAITVNGQRVDQLAERELMSVRADLGMIFQDQKLLFDRNAFENVMLPLAIAGVAPRDAGRRVRAALGMIFQEGALFDSLTVRENVGYKLYEETDMPIEEVDRRVEEILGFIGISEHIDKMPSELSGGQRRRVAIARAMAFRPSILLYDEATTGLDPITATTVDDEIIKLRDLEHVTSLLVTHQLRDAFYVATHMASRGTNGDVEIVPATPEKERETEFIMLRDGLICFEGDADALRRSTDPYIRTFLS